LLIHMTIGIGKAGRCLSVLSYFIRDLMFQASLFNLCQTVLIVIAIGCLVSVSICNRCFVSVGIVFRFCHDRCFTGTDFISIHLWILDRMGLLPLFVIEV